MATTYLRRAYSSFAVHILDIPPRLLAFLMFLLVLSLPVTKPTEHILLLLIQASMMAIFACSWDLLVGRTGQINLGHALFFGLGAYITALLWFHYDLPVWVTIPISVLIVTGLAPLIGFPCLRVKGPYLALVSMALPIIVVSLISYFRDYTQGERGIAGLPGFFPSLPYGQRFVAEYFLTLFLLLVSSVILYRIANSRTGIVFVSILDDELASKACGINVTKYKLMAFTISGLFAALAGAVSAHLLASGRSVTTASLDANLSFMVVIVAIFGGIGTMYGPIIAAYILQLIDQYVLVKIWNVPSEYHMLLFIIVIIILVLKWPRGVAKFVTDELDDLQEEREIEERGKHIWKRYRRKKRSPTPEA